MGSTARQPAGRYHIKYLGRIYRCINAVLYDHKRYATGLRDQHVAESQNSKRNGLSQLPPISRHWSTTNGGLQAGKGLFLVSWSTTVATADDWPQWQRPDRMPYHRSKDCFSLGPHPVRRCCGKLEVIVLDHAGPDVWQGIDAVNACGRIAGRQEASTTRMASMTTTLILRLSLAISTAVNAPIPSKTSRLCRAGVRHADARSSLQFG